MLNEVSSGSRLTKLTPVSSGASNSNMGEVGTLSAPRQAAKAIIRARSRRGADFADARGLTRSSATGLSTLSAGHPPRIGSCALTVGIVSYSGALDVHSNQRVIQCRRAFRVVRSEERRVGKEC